MKWFLILAAALLCNSLTTANADESSALLPPCGLVGEIQSRIADCKHSVGIQGEFQLVTRTLRGEEVYQGRRTGVIWSADIDDRTKQFENDQVDSICDQPHSEFGGIQRNWKLPSIHRYIQGLRYGIQSSLPGFSKRSYWSDTADGFYVNSRYIMEGSKKYMKQNGRYEFRHLEVELGEAFVKCIIEPNL